MASIRRNKAGNWEIRVSLGSDPATGRRRTAQETLPGALAERDARRAAAEFERRSKGVEGESSVGEGGAMRLRDWLSDYVAAVEALKASPASIPTYRTYAERYICPCIGRVRLVDLRPQHVDRMLARVRAGGGVGGAEVSAGTLRCVHAFLQGAMEQAVRYGYIPSNPVTSESRPKASRHEAESLDDADLAALYAGTAGRWDLASVTARIALGTGLRRAEVCGLRWKCVDGPGRSLRVSEVVVAAAGGGLVRKEPKSKAGVRTLRLDDSTWAWLMEWKSEQASALAGLGMRQTPLTPVASLDGKDTAPQRVTRAFKSLRSELGIEAPCTFHTLRHTHATHLLREGVDVKVLQRRLGHSSAAITLDTYGHVLPGADDAAAEAVAEVLARANRAMGPRQGCEGGDAR